MSLLIFLSKEQRHHYMKIYSIKKHSPNIGDTNIERMVIFIKPKIQSRTERVSGA